MTYLEEIVFTKNDLLMTAIDDITQTLSREGVYIDKHKKLINLLNDILKQDLDDSIIVKKYIYILADVINSNPILQDYLDLGIINYEKDIHTKLERNEALIDQVLSNINLEKTCYDITDKKNFSYLLSGESTVSLRDTCLLAHYARIFDDMPAPNSKARFCRGALFAYTDHYSWIYTDFNEPDDIFYDIVGNIYYLTGRPATNIPSILQRIFYRLLDYLDTPYVINHSCNLNISYNRLSFTYYLYFLLTASALFDELTAKNIPYREICKDVSTECKNTAAYLISWKLKHVDVR